MDVETYSKTVYLHLKNCLRNFIQPLYFLEVDKSFIFNLFQRGTTSTLHKKEAFLRNWSHLLNKYFIENLIFCAVSLQN